MFPCTHHKGLSMLQQQRKGCLGTEVSLKLSSWKSIFIFQQIQHAFILLEYFIKKINCKFTNLP